MYEPVKEKLISLGRTGLVCDIDDCICETQIYMARELISKYGCPENLSAEEVIFKYKTMRNIPYWKDKEAIDFEKEIYNDPEKRIKIGPIKGSREALIKLDEKIPIRGYLTGRPRYLEQMTNIWIDRERMPNKGVGVILGPNDDELDKLGITRDSFKPRLLEYLYPEVSGLIEDYLEIAKLVKPEYKGKIYLLGHEEGINQDNIIPCKDWNNLISKL